MEIWDDVLVLFKVSLHDFRCIPAAESYGVWIPAVLAPSPALNVIPYT